MSPVEGLRSATPEEIEIINLAPISGVPEESVFSEQSRWVLEALRRYGVITVLYQEICPGELKSFLGFLSEEARIQGLRLQTQAVRERKGGRIVGKNIIIKSLAPEPNLPHFLRTDL